MIVYSKQRTMHIQASQILSLVTSDDTPFWLGTYFLVALYICNYFHDLVITIMKNLESRFSWMKPTEHASWCTQNSLQSFCSLICPHFNTLCSQLDPFCQWAVSWQQKHGLTDQYEDDKENRTFI